MINKISKQKKIDVLKKDISRQELFIKMLSKNLEDTKNELEEVKNQLIIADSTDKYNNKSIDDVLLLSNEEIIEFIFDIELLDLSPDEITKLTNKIDTFDEKAKKQVLTYFVDVNYVHENVLFLQYLKNNKELLKEIRKENQEDTES